MFMMASYTAIKKNPKQTSLLSPPPKTKESNNNNKTPPPKPRNPHHNPEKKSYSCGNPKQTNNSKEYGEHGELKELVAGSIWMNEGEN